MSICPKPQRQRVWLTESAETDTKNLMVEVVVAVMDMRDIAKKVKKAHKAKQAKELGKTEGNFQASQW